jgi:hypothetical protein
MSEIERHDVEARLLSAVERLVEAVPHTLGPPSKHPTAGRAAHEALSILTGLRRELPDGSPVRRRYDELVRTLEQWRET